ncbi:MAG: hypothetical protein M9936_25410 [Caldilinea sp.]|nr:hypothetical protein [Caldilineaceae bacterium]MCO5213050.1 hypothetical protein [Caldilinea sp.]MCB0147003.1 hypothetical protein [Caldilineaceae bacterium]MCB9118351.1 hypothetical protein [Caldilineaceae bacterium]MCB9124949.1 hypothetical protein [Caldilineaceae bacterium]
MSDPIETRSPLQQAGDAMIDMRNEAIVQTANLYILGRKVVLAGVGVTFLGVDAAHAFVQQAIERGEIVEADGQKLASALRTQAMDRAKAADQARIDMIEAVTATLFESVNGILRALKVPEMKVTFREQPNQEGTEHPVNPTGAEGGG